MLHRTISSVDHLRPQPHTASAHAIAGSHRRPNSGRQLDRPSAIEDLPEPSASRAAPRLRPRFPGRRNEAVGVADRDDPIGVGQVGDEAPPARAVLLPWIELLAFGSQTPRHRLGPSSTGSTPKAAVEEHDSTPGRVETCHAAGESGGALRRMPGQIQYHLIAVRSAGPARAPKLGSEFHHSRDCVRQPFRAWSRDCGRGTAPTAVPYPVRSNTHLPSGSRRRIHDLDSRLPERQEAPAERSAHHPRISASGRRLRTASAPRHRRDTARFTPQRPARRHTTAPCSSRRGLRRRSPTANSARTPPAPSSVRRTLQGRHHLRPLHRGRAGASQSLTTDPGGRRRNRSAGSRRRTQPRLAPRLRAFTERHDAVRTSQPHVTADGSPPGPHFTAPALAAASPPLRASASQSTEPPVSRLETMHVDQSAFLAQEQPLPPSAGERVRACLWNGSSSSGPISVDDERQAGLLEYAAARASRARAAPARPRRAARPTASQRLLRSTASSPPRATHLDHQQHASERSADDVTSQHRRGRRFGVGGRTSHYRAATTSTEPRCTSCRQLPCRPARFPACTCQFFARFKRPMPPRISSSALDEPARAHDHLPHRR